MGETRERYAVVTGANKGIGFEVVKQLASTGIKVVLTARDEKRGLHALETLKASGLSDLVLFHQLDVADPASIASLADFVKSKFGKLDILVNNAGVGGIEIKDSELYTLVITKNGALPKEELQKAMTYTYDLAQECLQINYYGAKRTTEFLLPLLQLSDSPRVVNVSSTQWGRLRYVVDVYGEPPSSRAIMHPKYVSNEWAKGVFSDVDNLTEERVDEVLKEFLKDFEDDSLESKGWPRYLAAYTVAKVAMNAYTRILARKYPTFCINCVCPGYVKTDITLNTGFSTAEEGAAHPVKLALLPSGSPSGLFYIQSEASSFD